MTDYLPFADVAGLLPAREAAVGTPLDAFKVPEDPAPFVEPVMTAFEVAASPRVTFISARGATGKTAMARELARRLRAPLWSLGEDKAVSGDALTARLAAYLGVVDPAGEAPRQVPALIVDAMDEARLRVTGLSWDEFMTSLADYALAGVHLVILGRQRTIEDVFYSLVDRVPEISWYEISHFTPAQQREYVDLRALGGSGAPNDAYTNARTAVLSALNGAQDSSLDEAFAGYAPVLDAAARLLRPGENYLTVANDFQGSAAGGNRLKVLVRILDALLSREQDKVAELAIQLGLEPSDVYKPGEQASWLAADLLGAHQPTLDWCPESKRVEYAERIVGFLADHPFRDGAKWASPVFSSFVANEMRDEADPGLLAEVGAESGLLFEFAAAAGATQEQVVDEQQFAALHGSLLAGQWTSATSVVSVRTGDPTVGGAVETVAATLSLSQPDWPGTSIAATVLLDRPGRLHLYSPLANLDVEFSGEVVVSSRGASIDLGPEVFIRANSIELLGSSVQVSKDTSSNDELAGPTVELEVSDSFQTAAALDGSLAPRDFSLSAPSSVKLSYPWVHYRSAPDDDSGGASPDERARRFLNKLMSLARRHGHGGRRAVYIKKLEGRQGLSTADFQSAVAVLIEMGAASLSGQLLFIDEEWDQFRYDGKARPGMTGLQT